MNPKALVTLFFLVSNFAFAEDRSPELWLVSI